MPPRKEKAQQPPTRRSARLASIEKDEAKPSKTRAPAFSVESSIGRLRQGERIVPLLTQKQRKEIIDSLMSRDEEKSARILNLENELTETRSERDRALAKPRTSSLRRDFGWKEMERKYGQKQAASAAKAASPPSAPVPLPPQAPAVSSSPPTAPSRTTIEPLQPASAPPKSWRTTFTSVASYFTSPFLRKRPAEDLEEEMPLQKRVRTTEPQQAIAPVETNTKPPRDTPQSTLSNRKRPAAEDTDPEDTMPSQKRILTTEAQEIPEIIETQSTPRAQAPPQRGSLHGPSTKRPTVPTSLSTITEYTERSFLSNAPETTPSRPSKVAPRPMPVQQTPATPYTIRRAAAIREAKQASRSTAPTSQTPWTFERLRSSPAKPRLPNADARAAKIQRFRDLQKELEELKQDKDIIDIESHVVRNRKRVKIDKLVEIPHNRPGESEGTFRVPEVDSDDEMEVDIDTEEMSNVFEEADKQPEQPEPPEQPVFVFPEVPQQAPDYWVPDEYKQACLEIFEEGLAKFIEEQNTEAEQNAQAA